MHQRADGKGKMPSFCTRQVSTATKEKRVNPSAQTSASKIRFFFFISAMNFIKENRTHRNVHKTISAHTWVTHAHMECQNTACPQAPHALALPLPPSRAATLTSDPECSAGAISPHDRRSCSPPDSSLAAVLLHKMHRGVFPVLPLMESGFFPTSNCPQ